MISHNVLVTGGSGYLGGGTLLARWKEADLSGYGKIFSLVRTNDQAKATPVLYTFEPLRIDLEDEDTVNDAIVSKDITIVLYLIDAYYLTHQIYFIKALAEAKKRTGQETHFIYATNTNIGVVEAGLEFGVKVYLFSPCIVYGKGEGFGNKISIQTVDVVIAANAAARVYEFDQQGQIWPVSHVLDIVSLYFALLNAILTNKKPGHGKSGFYLALSGKIAWRDIYAGIAKALAQRGVISDERIEPMTDSALVKISNAQNVSPSSVIVKNGGRSTYTAENGKSLGWKPQYPLNIYLTALMRKLSLSSNPLIPSTWAFGENVSFDGI